MDHLMQEFPSMQGTPLNQVYWGTPVTLASGKSKQKEWKINVILTQLGHLDHNMKLSKAHYIQ